jgi:GcrA cell cycle regulator
MTNQFPTSWWTEERIAELRERWSNNETFGEITRAMGAVSRNAVIGKSHRLGLHRPKDLVRIAIRKSNTARARRVTRANGHRHAVKCEDEPTGFCRPVTLLELTETTCRWPGPATCGPALAYCGNPAIPGHPYCLTHYRLAYASRRR